jgi:hypothetical protein
MGSTDAAHLYPSMSETGPSQDYRPQPVEIDLNNSSLNNSRTLPSPSASAAAAWDASGFPHDFGEVSAHGPSNIPRQNNVENHNRGTTQEPIWQWYAAQDGPWVPKGISEIPRRRVSNQRMPMRYDTQYRQGNPSEAGAYHFVAPPSDSGYGSNAARRSDGNGSIFSADIPDQEDCQSLPSHVPAEFQSYHATDPWILPSTSKLDSQRVLICPDCDKVVKTRSELKYEIQALHVKLRLSRYRKHDLRHKKPFKCEYPGCTRIEGFSTTNDLERHTKSKHPSAVQGLESTKRYRCCVQGCKSKEKSWPRLDNFKSHLKRMHHFDAEEQFDDMIRR